MRREPALTDLTGLCVLVVDDEATVREGMRALLTGWGCSVILGGGEDEAIAAVRANGATPDALIVDYRLREGRTGTQAIARLRREFNADIPSLIVTGDTAPQPLRDVRDAGYPLLHKPAQPAMLRAFLQSAKRQRRRAEPA